MDTNLDPLTSLEELEKVIVPANWGAGWALDELGERLEIDEASWIRHLTERATEAEKALLELFSPEARDLVRLQSLRIEEELAPCGGPQELLATMVTIAWLAEQLLNKKVLEREKNGPIVGRRRDLRNWLRHMKMRGRMARKLLTVMRKLP